MASRAALTLFTLCVIGRNSALLFHGDNVPGHTTTPGPLGRDATLSLLVKTVLDLEARMKSQEQEIQTLKNQKASDDNNTASTMNNLMLEYIDIKTAFGFIKQEFDQNNNQTGLKSLKTRLDNMVQSVRYLTLSLQGHEIHDEEMNRTIYRELHNLNAKLENKIQVLHVEILNLTYTMSLDIQRLESMLSIQQTNLTTLESELAIHQMELQNVSNSIQDAVDFSLKIRLVGGDSNSGRVEVLYRGQWGTVCDDDFDNNDAVIICEMLGKATANVVAYGGAHFGQGTGPIVYDDLNCNGSEADIRNCQHNGLGHHNCGHTEDAGVKCG